LKVSMLAGLVLSSLAFSQDLGTNTGNPNALLFPYGMWPNCEVSNPLPLCIDFQPGNESYLLFLKPVNTSTTAFHYIVKGTRADGVLLTVESVVLKSKTDPVTTSLVGFGAPVKQTSVFTEELTQ